MGKEEEEGGGCKRAAGQVGRRVAEGLAVCPGLVKRKRSQLLLLLLLLLQPPFQTDRVKREKEEEGRGKVFHFI